MTTREDTLSLAPCPFCGGSVRLEQTIDRREWWGVVCRNTENVGGTCAIQQRPSASKEAAVARWNRRAAPTPPAAEAPGQEPVAVKPLEWSQKPPPSYDAEPFVFWAAGIGGHYRADPDGTLWLSHDPFVWQTHASQKEAKAAAQADYEQRIRSALVSAAPTYADAEAKGFERGLEAAAKWHGDEVAHCQAQIEENNVYLIRSGAASLDSDANRYCRDNILFHRTSAAAIRSLASPAPKGET